WGKRIMAITNCPWEFIRNEKKVDELDTMINSISFEQVLTEIINATAWGKSLVELGTKTVSRFGKDEQVLSSYLVKRQHYRPKEGMIVKEQYDSVDSSRAIRYREGKYTNYVADIGNDTDLGLILKAVPYVLLKRGDVGDWAQFVQLFGMPFREYRYNGYDEGTLALLKKNAEEMGSAPYMIMPDGTTLTLHNAIGGNGTGAGDVFNKLADFCDKQISVLVLGNTETTTSSKSSGYAQSETHMKTQIEVFRDDIKNVTRILNDIVRPILYNLGYQVADGHFKIRKETNLQEILDRLKIIESVKKIGEPIDSDYVYEVSGVPKPDNYDELKAKQEEDKQAALQSKPQFPADRNAKKPKEKKPVKLSEEDETFITKLRSRLADFFDPAT
ncbi:MAG TPA: DUF935 family protein, partial [Lacibacter sp.]|nr:DUF935 family protein [Lacibacter sp.]